MTLHTYSIHEKLEAVARACRFFREQGYRRDPELHDFLKRLNAVAKDLEARKDLPRNNALGALRRDLARLQQGKTELGYDRLHLCVVANTLIHHWHTVEQALENFGEETAE